MTTTRAELVEASFSEVFADALSGQPCYLRGMGAGPLQVPVEAWHESADDVDQRMLDRCAGATIDVGCGPGRMCEELVVRGRRALGVDVVPEAVRLTRERGAPAVEGDIFAPVVAEGLWRTALLADGNLGIGGDPVSLVRRLVRLLGPAGRIVAEVDPDVAGIISGWARLETPRHRSKPFRWAVVGADAVPKLAEEVGLRVLEQYDDSDRSFAVLAKHG